MSGVTWDKKTQGMWLASNGRWYPANQYPAGWHMTALPPAPGQAEHGVASEVLRRMRTVIDPNQNQPVPPPTFVPASYTGDAERENWTGSTAHSTPPRSKPAPPPARSTTRSPAPTPGSRQAADARVTSQSTYASKLPSAAPPPKSIGAPPPPARSPARTAPPPPVVPPAPGQTIVAGDLGAVLKNARKQIAKAINEAEL